MNRRQQASQAAMEAAGEPVSCWSFTMPRILLAVVGFLLVQSAFGQDRFGRFNGADLKVGQAGTMHWVNARVVKVINDGWMIVNIEDVQNAKGQDQDVVVKVSTKKIVDGQKWYGNEWKTRTGADAYEITETKTVKLKDGGERKYFVLEPKK